MVEFEVERLGNPLKEAVRQPPFREKFSLIYLLMNLTKKFPHPPSPRQDLSTSSGRVARDLRQGAGDYQVFGGCRTACQGGL